MTADPESILNSRESGRGRPERPNVCLVRKYIDVRSPPTHLTFRHRLHLNLITTAKHRLSKFVTTSLCYWYVWKKGGAYESLFRGSLYWTTDPEEIRWIGYINRAPGDHFPSGIRVHAVPSHPRPWHQHPPNAPETYTMLRDQNFHDGPVSTKRR